MKRPVFVVVLVLVVAAISSCTKGSWDEDEPPCPNEIIVEDYEGPQHMVLGIGMGGLAALDMAFDHPEIFGAAAALAAPTDLRAWIGAIETQLRDFDDIPDEPGRAAFLGTLRDAFIALGNPFYNNPLSRLFPPGVSGSDPTSVTGVIDAQNPAGATPAITFVDESGVTIDFLLALDTNGNGVRDAGEPIILQAHEPFDDASGDGVRDEGETFSDTGLDGVAGTGDFGEGNGAFDVSPNFARWLMHDPALRVGASLNTANRYTGAIYLDAGVNDPWSFADQADRFAQAMQTAMDAAAPPDEEYCLDFTVGLYDDFLGNFPYPTRRVWFPEKNVRMNWGPTTGGADAHLGSDEVQIARWTHALSFLSARVPNGLFGDGEHDANTYYETHTFESASLGDAKVEYSIYLPAGYYSKRNRWKTYPLALVLLDRGQSANDVIELAVSQGYLAREGFGQQTILVMIEGAREATGGAGYHFFFDQTAFEFPGRFRSAVVTDLFNHLAERYRIRLRLPDGVDPFP